MSIIGAAFDFNNFLNERLPDMSSWTDNLYYQFAKKLATGEVELHYKCFGKSSRYCGEHYEERVNNFKKLES